MVENRLRRGPADRQFGVHDVVDATTNTRIDNPRHEFGVSLDVNNEIKQLRGGVSQTLAFGIGRHISRRFE